MKTSSCVRHIAQRIAEYDKAHPEHHSAQQARLAVCFVAGASRKVPVYFAGHPDAPPRLQRRKEVITEWHDGGLRPATQRKQRVVVGQNWLRVNMPAVFAAFAAARITGEQADLIPQPAKRGVRW